MRDGLKGTVRKTIQQAHSAFDLLGVRRQRETATRSARARTALSFGARALLVKEHMDDRERVIHALIEESKQLRAMLGERASQVPLVKVPSWEERRMR